MTDEQNNEEQQYPELRTVHEVAQHLRVDDTTVRRWIKNGALDAIRLPKRGKREGYRITVETIQQIDSSYQG